MPSEILYHKTNFYLVGDKIDNNNEDVNDSSNVSKL